MAAGDACPTRASEWAPAGLSLQTCTWHHAVDGRTITIWPDVYRRWARDEGLLTDVVGDPVPGRAVGSRVTADGRDGRTSRRLPGRPDGARARALTIVRPLTGAVFLFDPTLRPEFQALTLEAQGASGALEWFVDGAPIPARDRSGRVKWPLAPGRHALVVRDEAGRSAETEIVVR